jgi:hypothetical protein
VHELVAMRIAVAKMNKKPSLDFIVGRLNFIILIITAQN